MAASNSSVSGPATAKAVEAHDDKSIANGRNTVGAYKRVLSEIGIFSFFINVLMLILPVYMLQVYDRVLPSSSRETLLFLTIMAVVALAVMASLETVRSIYAARVAARMDIANAEKALRSAIASDRAPLGDIQALRDLSTLRSFIGSRTAFALLDLPFAPLFIVLLWFIHPALFVLTAVGASLLVCLAIANQLITAKRARRVASSSIAAMSMAQMAARNGDTLRAMGMTANAIDVFGSQHGVSLTEGGHLATTNAVFAGLSRFVRLTLQIAVLGMGALLVLRADMTAGMIFAASIISGRALQPVDQLIGSWRQYVDVHAAWRRFGQATAKHVSAEQRIELPKPTGVLRLQNVNYAVDTPPNEAPRNLLKQIKFDVPKGSSVAIVGPSGAGKSTLARLMVGIVKPSNGCVRLDGADIAHWASDELGRHIGYLPQDLEFLPGTIAQNIARFDPDAEDTDVVDAAKRAHVHDLIQALPDGYNTSIGAGRPTLSGGERQRIGLARAVFGHPCLLVLDEPDAHLDDAGEKALARALEDARLSESTVLIVTQRKSIVSQVDRLLVLKEGRMEDYGSRIDVLQRQGLCVQRASATDALQAPNPGNDKSNRLGPEAPSRRAQLNDVASDPAFSATKGAVAMPVST